MHATTQLHNLTLKYQVATKGMLFFRAIVLACVFVASAGCSSAVDCEYLGSCTAGACKCFPGFTGATCSSLDLQPTASPHARLWPNSPLAPPTPVPSPTPPSPDDFNTTSWGASVVFDESDGLWHAMIDCACGAKGVLASGGAASFIAHATSSKGPDHGFSLRAMAT